MACCPSGLSASFEGRQPSASGAGTERKSRGSISPGAGSTGFHQAVRTRWPEGYAARHARRVGRSRKLAGPNGLESSIVHINRSRGLSPSACIGPMQLRSATPKSNATGSASACGTWTALPALGPVLIRVFNWHCGTVWPGSPWRPVNPLSPQSETFFLHKTLNHGNH